MPRLVLTDCPKCGGERRPKWNESRPGTQPHPRELEGWGSGLHAVCLRCGFVEPTASLDALPQPPSPSLVGIII